MSETYILAIDQGTSGTKAVIFDSQAQLVAKGFEELKSYHPQHGFVEQNPEEIYQSVIHAVRKCLEVFKQSVNPRLAEIQFCGISSQRETYLLWDKKGIPLHNAVVRQCKRSVEICDQLKNTELEKSIIERTGLVVDPYFSGTKVKWLYENVDSVKQMVDKGRAFGGTVDTWLLYKLTGGKRYLTDYTNASRTLFFNIDQLAWDDELLRAFGLQTLNLPEPRPSAFSFGETTFEGLLSHPIKITGMIGDSHAAAFGEKCFEAGEVKATLGSGCSILMNTGAKRVTSRNGLVSTICWSLPGRTAYALEGIIVTAGATIQWLRDQFNLLANVSASEAMATSVTDNNGVYLIPAFSGLGAPHWKMDSKAVITGLTFDTDKNHIVRAALESIPYQIKDVITVMEAEAGVPVKELMADGGITANAFVMQFIANLLNTQVRNISMEEVSALGAAYMAGLQGGLYKDIDELKEISHQQRRFVPGDKKVKALEYYKGWQAALKTMS
jgi:glycerol kinase